MSDPRLLLLHLGYPKSGTTTLQGGVFPACDEIFFGGKSHATGRETITDEANRFRRLINYGTFYQQTAQAASIREGLERIWNESGKDRMLLSLEGFTNPFVDTDYATPRDILSKARDIARMLAPWREAGMEIRILVTLRAQRSLIPSLFSQSFLQGFSSGLYKPSYDGFLDFMLDDEVMGFGADFRFDVYLEHLGTLFGPGNVIATTMSDPEAGTHVARFLGIDAERCNALMKAAPVRNVRQRGKGRHMMPKSGGVTTFETNTGIALRRKAFRLRDRLNLRFGKPVIWEVPDRTGRIEAFYADSNARLKELYGIAL